jgi:hypothetical protein
MDFFYNNNNNNNNNNNIDRFYGTSEPSGLLGLYDFGGFTVYNIFISRITGFLDFVHCPIFQKKKKLDMLTLSK